mgnify:CR=1 FL=1|jgi:hypothetical protein
MLQGNLSELADALISGDKDKADGKLRDFADAILSRDKNKAA